MNERIIVWEDKKRVKVMYDGQKFIIKTIYITEDKQPLYRVISLDMEEAGKLSQFIRERVG